MQTVIKGEKRSIAMQVTRQTSGSFVIESASFTVEGIQQGDCSIDQVNKEISFLLDTTLTDFKKIKKYVAEFTVTIAELDKIIKGRVIINIV